jgi:NAD(P)-dependent dehydrogenase (short-subunit alcohol dehydrogenase family)
MSEGATSLHNRRIVVTGSGRGLGYAFAERLCRDGADVIIAEVDAELGAAAEASLRAKGYKARFIQTDVSAEDSVMKMAADANEGVEAIHGLVANAGWANNVGGRAYDEIDIEVWDRMMAINVRGTWLSVKAVGPRMKEGGSIITLSSATAFTGSTRLLHYVTSKAAIAGMTRSLACELGERGIRVNAISPGLTEVEVTKDIPQWRWQDYANRKFIKRNQTPEDLDGVVAFLMSDDSCYITGQTLAVDGGLVLK